MKMRKGAIHVQYVLSMFETRRWCPNTQVYMAPSGERAKLEMRVTFGVQGGGWWRK